MRESQAQMILRYITETGSITPVDAMREFACMRLSGRILDLRKLGYPIRTTMEDSVNRFGRRVSFARYSLPSTGQMEMEL